MNRLALLIGSDYDGLQGPKHDLVAMKEVLRARGFAVRECPPAKATRAGILAAYEKIIADAGPGDSVVIYYSGHGGSAQPPETGPYRPADLQYILPVDYGESTAGDFRGIASAELSVLQSRLTAVTRDVTVILDCCHAGLMSRDGSLRLRTMRERAPHAWLRDRLDRLRLPMDLVPSESNENAVRIVACAPGQRAFEGPDDQGVCRGVLTNELTRALTEVGEVPVTWAALLDLIRYRMTGRMLEQRPEAEGPADRVLFTTERQELLNSLPVTPLHPPERVRLDGGALLRVQPDDEFVVMPPGRTLEDRADRVGTLTIDQVTAMSVAGTVVFEPGRSAVPTGARAFRTKVTAPQIVVRVPSGDPRSERALEALRRTALARPAEHGKEASAEIRFDDSGGIVLCDHIGPLHPPYPSDAQGFADLARAVLIHARATQLRCLAGDPSAPLGTEVTVEWGLVVDGARQPPPVAGSPLTPNQRIFVTVHNQGDVPVYVSMLDIGLSGRAALLMRGTPSGRLLLPRRAYTYGYNDARRELAGAGLSWPKQLDPVYARTETILVVLTSEPQSLVALEQPEIVRTRSQGSGTRLRDMIDQIAVGGSREVEPDLSTSVRYEIHAIDFDMTPSE
ncbi:caspase family protein [Actinoplanes sp. ATCC 53533]|uniref:caspase family protein n=1 Tax=Actinoplanes sp. ATCC 53533 TaxID=1288362 RepID=UPI0013157AC8|nr:caspase family protein [Actinoplanes sp. ATCC 53533]